MTKITLREVTKDNMWAVCDLKVSEDQTQFVATNDVSLAQARYSDHAWFRAIFAGDAPVGFMMLYDNPHSHEYHLWRLMIDHRHQGRGYARQAMLQLIEHVKSRPGASALSTSCVPKPGGPEPFYLGLGFVDTGEIDDGEKVLELRWAEPLPKPEPRVKLKPIDQENVRAICRLQVAAEQQQAVIENTRSLAESLFCTHLRARGLYVDDEAVGFMMWEDDPEKGVYYLWRLMIDQRFQGKGYGREAMEQLIELVQKRPGARELKTSFVPGPTGPEDFYRRLGFAPTGQWLDAERVYSLRLGDRLSSTASNSFRP